MSAVHLDVRLPIGWLLLVIGSIIAGWGLVSEPAIYAKSLGLNVNLGWGTVLMAAGAALVSVARRRR